MGLSVLHTVRSPEKNYVWKDRLNSKTGSLVCQFLEWTGWYNQDIYQRLLGHYRLFQHFKDKNKANNGVPLPKAYIISYRVLYPLKFFISSLMAILYFLGTLGGRYYPLQVEGVNKWLIANQSQILEEFLVNAEKDFSKAVCHVIEHINGQGFNSKVDPVTTNSTSIFVQNRLEYKIFNHNNHYYIKYNSTTHSNSSGIKGKEKGVFSKKQILILFDLLANTANLERIDFTKPNKFEATAEMLQAITGKSKDSWQELLKDVRNRGLYEYRNSGEMKQLIITLTNMAEVLRKAGFRKLASLCDKKLRDFDQIHRNA